MLSSQLFIQKHFLVHYGNKIEFFKSTDPSTHPFLYDIFMNLFLSMCDSQNTHEEIVLFILWEFMHMRYLSWYQPFAFRLTPSFSYITQLPTCCLLSIAHWVELCCPCFNGCGPGYWVLGHLPGATSLKRRVIFFNQCKNLALKLCCSLLFFHKQLLLFD